MASIDTPEAAFRPQQQETATGFEAWSAIVHDPVERIALWLRYSRYVPKGTSRAPQALLWVSLFSPDDPERHSFSSQSYPLSQARFETDRIAIKTGSASGAEDGTEAVLGPGYAVGELKTPAGRLRWDLEFRHDFAPYERSRAAKLHSLAISPFGRARGTIRIGQAKGLKIKDARLMYSHLWGPDRVPEMYWAYAPYLKTSGAAASFGIAAVDALYVKASALTPASCSGTALSAGGELLHDHALARGVFGGNKFDYPTQLFRFNFGGRRVELSAQLNQSQKTGFIYRGSDGTPHFNVHSDVSALQCQTKTEEGKSLKFSTADFAAVEFQGAKAWPGVMYMDPYD